MTQHIKKPIKHNVKTNKWLGGVALATNIMFLKPDVSLAITNIPISEVYDRIENKEIKRIQISSDNKRVLFEDNEGDIFSSSNMPSYDILKPLIKSKAEVIIEPDGNDVASVLTQVLTFIIISSFVLRSINGGPLSQISRNVDHKVETNTNVTFSEVLGCDYAKLEIQEIVDFLKYPDKYSNMGLKIPKGILLSGPPGVGKTLIAKATAGESKVPFFSASGSDFVEMFIGMGAARIRKLFAEARKFPRSIIYIDEFDALGKKRGVNIVSGGNDEREQTLNQLLVEMDGFSSSDGIVVMASTNRNELLDSALLRPGRFDRQIQMRLPDSKGRKDILELYSNNVLTKGIDWTDISFLIPGYSGADIRNLINEAGIFALRRNSTVVELSDINDAIEKQDMGVKLPNIRPPEIDRLVSYHEAGHAYVASKLEGFDRVSRISIIPTSKGAGGFTRFKPQNKYVDGGMYNKRYIEHQIIATLGGRAAEEIMYGENEVTTGASSDFRQATNLARQMITQFGMNSEIGLINVDPNDSLNSEVLKGYIVAATKEIVDKSYLRAKKIIVDGKDEFINLSNTLLEKEIMNTDTIDKMLYS